MKLPQVCSGLSSQLRTKNRVMPDYIVRSVPVDILEVMADHLPLQSLHALTQTCRGLHAALHHRLRAKARKTPQPDFLECLYKIASHLSDAWVCHECAALHRADPADTPHHAAPSCLEVRYVPLHCGPREDSYQLHRHHVQLTLRLSRLASPTPAQQVYLRRLLAPHTRAKFRINPNPGFPNSLEASFTLTPKVVHGRYLRKSVWTFEARPYSDGSGAVTVTADRLGAVALCCHLVTSPLRRNEASGRAQRWEHLSALHVALTRALADGYQYFGECSFCVVDFCITPARANRALRIEAWQDLGAEGAVHDPNWRATAWDPAEMSVARHMQTRRLLQRQGGLVRRMYGESRFFMTKGLVQWKSSDIYDYMADSHFYHPLM